MAVIIGICGGSGSGKSRLASELADRLGRDRVTILPFDAYYKDLRDMPAEDRARVNFDHPDSLDAELYASHLDALRDGLDVCMPVYDFATHQRADDLTILPARDIVIAEGILLFAFDNVAERCDLRVYRRCPADVRFERRLARDVEERGRTPESVRQQFDESVGPMHDRFVEPSAHHAHRVVEHGQPLDEVVTAISAEITAARV